MVTPPMLIPKPAQLPLRATTLAEMARTLMPAHLDTEEAMAFYVPDVQPLRGLDRIGQMCLSLEDSLREDVPFKGFLIGHPGAGKTTELRHLLQGLQAQVRPLWLDVITELNPGTLRFYDVLLLILVRLVQEAAHPSVIGFEDHDLKALLVRVTNHLSTKWTKHLRIDQSEFSAGLQIPVLTKLLANIRQGSTKEQGTQEYELSFVSDLVRTVNDVVKECNRLLAKNRNGQQWLIVLENFEKIGLAPSVIRDLFIGLRPHFQDLQSHLVVTIPAWLQYSEDANVILPPNFQSFLLHDIPVYKQDHSRDGAALDALVKVVGARTDLGLFDSGVLERCCIASGGNFRDLFSIVRDSMLTARLRKASTIDMSDAGGAIASLRNAYKESLGSGTIPDPKAISLEAKLQLLKALYERKDLSAEVPGPVLHQLLRQRCVLQYNGSGWKGVHPLVVDLLIEFGHLDPGSPGGSGAA